MQVAINDKFDRLLIEGNRVKVIRRDDSRKELMRGVRQLAKLYRIGMSFDQVLIQVTPQQMPNWKGAHLVRSK